MTADGRRKDFFLQSYSLHDSLQMSGMLWLLLTSAHLHAVRWSYQALCTSAM